MWTRGKLRTWFSGMRSPSSLFSYLLRVTHSLKYFFLISKKLLCTLRKIGARPKQKRLKIIQSTFPIWNWNSSSFPGVKRESFSGSCFYPTKNLNHTQNGKNSKSNDKIFVGNCIFVRLLLARVRLGFPLLSCCLARPLKSPTGKTIRFLLPPDHSPILPGVQVASRTHVSN